MTPTKDVAEREVNIVSQKMEDFNKQFPLESGLFWTPSRKDITEFLRYAMFSAYRQGVVDSEALIAIAKEKK